jgi:hypothetical protein
MEKQGVTFYRFLSEVRAFLSRLVSDPVNAMPSKFLKDNGFSKKKLVNELIKRGVLTRNEKILTPDKTGEEQVKYSVQYKVKRKDFETKIKRIYIKFFEKNVPEKSHIDECEGAGDGGAVAGDGGASIGGTSSFSVGADTTRGDVGHDVVFGMINRPGYLADRDKKKKKNEVKPENILGKDVKAEGKKPRRVFITEEQLQMLLETGINSVAPDDGQLGPVRPGCMTFRKNNGKLDDSAFKREPGFSVKRLK